MRTLGETPSHITVLDDDGSEIAYLDYLSDPSFSFIITQHGLLGPVQPFVGGHSTINHGMYVATKKGLTPEALRDNNLVVIGDVGPMDTSSRYNPYPYLELITAGRAFPGAKVCSFWKSNLNEIFPAYLNVLRPYFEIIGESLEAYSFESWVEGPKLLTLSQIRDAQASDSEPSLSPEAAKAAREREELLQNLHTMEPGEKAAAREKLGVTLPPDKSAARALKAGFNSAAAFNAARSTSEDSARFFSLFD